MLEQTEQSIAYKSDAMESISNPNTSFRVAIFRGSQGLDQIRQDWTAITDRMVGHRHYFHLWEWHRAYLDSLATEPDASVFYVAYLASVPMAILPLRLSVVRQAGFRFRVLETPYHKHMPLSDMVCDPAPEHSDIPGRMIDSLRRSARNCWDAILLRGLLAESSPMGRGWVTLPGPRIQIVRSRCDSLHYASHEELLANVSKNFRSNLRKARNKLAKLPQVKYDFVRDSALLPEAFARFIRVEASGWKGIGGTNSAIGLDTQLRSFYERLLRSFGPSGGCQINLLMLGDDCIAGQFCLRLDGTLYILKIGYSESHAALAPGNLLLEECIRRSSSGMDPVHCWNLISDVSWHHHWEPSQEVVFDLWICRRTPRGHACHALASVKQSLRSYYQKLKPRLTDRECRRC